MNRSTRGSALVICLCVIVLLTAVTVAFLVRSQSLRTIESSGAGRVRSEIMARSALEYTIALLTKEITDPSASDAIGEGNTRIFKPKAAINMLPKVQIKSSLNGARSIHMPSIIKQSIAAMTPLATTIPSGNPNKQGRSVAPARWNDPWFYFSTGQFNVPTKTPDWIYFDDDGATKTSSPSIMGRATFNIYQIDNLLDISIAGYPSAFSGAVQKINALKGSLAGADITKIGSFVPVLNDPSNKYVDVRNRRSVRNGTYFNNVLSNTNGFLEPEVGDTQFVSRLDLLRFSRSVGLDNNPLAYLTAWSRALDAPSWNPTTKTDANVFAPSVLRTSEATITDYYIDGTTRTRKAKTGDGVASRRFPLNRLAWFDDEHAANRAAAIRQYFGLTQAANGYWQYEDDEIKTLSELTSENRDPNFFEMLKAAIASGSLGQSFGSGDAALTITRDANKDLQILRIGASIIDYAGITNKPTTVAMNPGGTMRFAYGVKDLPYLYGVRFRQIVKTNSSGAIEQIDQFALPILVNPQADAIVSASRPPIRIRLVGSVANPTTKLNNSDTSLTSRFSDDPAQDHGRILSVDPNAFRVPAPTENWTPPDPSGNPDQATMPDYFTSTFRAFWLATGSGSGSVGTPGGKAELQNFNLVMEYWNGAIWMPYDALIGDGRGDPATGLGTSVPVEFASASVASPNNSSFTGANTLYFLKPDPRTNRWGIIRGTTGTDPKHATVRSRIPNESASSYVATITPSDIFPALPDPDGITRYTDLAIGSQSTEGVKKMLHVLSDTFSESKTSQLSEERTPILHRPFYTVGELGGVFRDQPWKTLNFATTNSGDAALLDYFCINEVGPDAVVAGRLNLNLQSPPDSFDNQLAGTSIQIGGTTTITASETGTFRDQITTYTAKTPFLSPAGLVGVPAATKLPTNLRMSKQRMETAVRALGTSCQTRTWNFFVDLIAQTGKLAPKTSTDLEKDFVVEGEYRFWMHVAIDRFTGKVVDSHIEAYQE